MGQFSMGAKPGFGVGEFTPPFMPPTPWRLASCFDESRLTKAVSSRRNPRRQFVQAVVRDVR